MFFKLGAHLFSKKALSNIMLIILIAISFFLTNICVGILNREYSLINSVQKFDKENTYYYVHDVVEEGFFGISNTEISTDDLEKAIDNEDIDIGYIYYGNAEVVKKYYSSFAKMRYITYIGCDEKTSENLYYNQLMEGKWYTEAEHKDGYVNVVALEGSYNVGDVFSFNIATGKDENNLIIYSKIDCIVTGVLRNGSHMLNPSIEYESMDFTQIMPETYSETNAGEMSVIYFSNEDPEIKEILKNMTLSNCCMLYTNDDISDQELNEIIYNLNNTGRVASIQEICDNTYVVMYDTIMKLVPFIFGVFLLTIVCLICIMTLNSTDHLKTYSIYYLCGMNWSDMKKILFSYSIIIMTGAIIVFSVIFSAASIQGDLLNIIVPAYNNLFITVTLFVVIVFVMVFIPYIMLSRLSPMDAVREN